MTNFNSCKEISEEAAWKDDKHNLQLRKHKGCDGLYTCVTFACVHSTRVSSGVGRRVIAFFHSRGIGGFCPSLNLGEWGGAWEGGGESDSSLMLGGGGVEKKKSPLICICAHIVTRCSYDTRNTLNVP